MRKKVDDCCNYRRVLLVDYCRQSEPLMEVDTFSSVPESQFEVPLLGMSIRIELICNPISTERSVS